MYPNVIPRGAEKCCIWYVILQVLQKKTWKYIFIHVAIFMLLYYSLNISLNTTPYFLKEIIFFNRNKCLVSPTKDFMSTLSLSPLILSYFSAAKRSREASWICSSFCYSCSCCLFTFHILLCLFLCFQIVVQLINNCFMLSSVTGLTRNFQSCFFLMSDCRVSRFCLLFPLGCRKSLWVAKKFIPVVHYVRT